MGQRGPKRWRDGQECFMGGRGWHQTHEAHEGRSGLKATTPPYPLPPGSPGPVLRGVLGPVRRSPSGLASGPGAWARVSPAPAGGAA